MNPDSSIKRVIIFNVKHLHIDSPYIGTCSRQLVTDEGYEYDPGIGEMIVNPDSTISYFRVR